MFVTMFTKENMDPVTLANISANKVSRHADVLLDLVKRRVLEFDVAELYGGGSRSIQTLGAIVEDFDVAYNTIKQQSIERRVVSVACLVAMTDYAAKTWIMDAFSNVIPMGRATNAGKFFILQVIQPLTACDMNDAMYNSYVKNAEFVVDAEKRLPWAVPCFIETYDISGFGDLSIANKYGVLAHVETRNSVVPEVRAAFCKFQKLGGADIRLADAAAPVFEDICVDGFKLTETKDGYVNIAYLSTELGETRSLYNDYIKLAANKSFVDSFKRADGMATVLKSANAKGSIWVHPKIALHLAKWKGLDGLAKALEGFVDDTVPVESTIVSSDRVEIRKIVGPGFSTEQRTPDGYINLAELADSVGKKIANISQIEAFHSRLEQISALKSIPVGDLVLTTIGMFSSSWGHPDASLYIVETYRSKAVEDFKAALAEEHPAYEIYTTVRDNAGKPVTRHRSSDGYFDSGMISKWSPKTNSLSDLLKSKNGAALRASLAGSEITKKTPGLYGGTWVHPSVATALAGKGGLKTFDTLVDEAFSGVIVHESPATSAKVPPRMDEAGAEQPQDTAGKVQIVPEHDSGPASASMQSSGPPPRREDDGSEMATAMVDVRPTDGYVNASKLCKSVGKFWCQFSVLTWTSKFMDEMESIHGDEVLVEDAEDGTWVHPKIAIRLAEWCSPEFKTVVTALVADYIDSETVTPVVPTGFQKNQGMEVYKIEPGEPLIGDWAIPSFVLAPVTFYVIQVGTRDRAITLFKWGICDEYRSRLGQHRLKYENVLTRILITVGQSSAKRLEDNVKAMMGRRRVILMMKRHPLGYESFKVASTEADNILREIRVHVESKFRDIVQHSWMDGTVHYDKAEVEARQNKRLEAEQEITRREIALEQEKTKRELAVLKATNDNLRLQLDLANK